MRANGHANNNAHTPRHIVVCCDGTWCGEAMGTVTNTKMLADSFANPHVVDVRLGSRTTSCHRVRTSPSAHPSCSAPITHLRGRYVPATRAYVFYFQGIGASSAEEVSSEEFLLDAALGLSINQRCIEVYEAIVQHFEPGVKIWLFGHSRCACAD